MAIDSTASGTMSGSTAALPTTVEDDWRLIRSRVTNVRWRHRLKFVASGLLLALALFAMAFLGFSLADVLFKLSMGTRVSWLAVTGGGLLAVLFLAIVRPWRRMGGSIPIAREIEHTYPELNQQLTTSLEFGGNPGLVQDASSPELVGALIRQTRDRSEPLNFGRTIRWRPLIIAALIAFLVAGGVALYAGYSPRLFRSTWQRFIQPMASVAPPTLTVIGTISPGDDEVPVETSVPIEVTLSGVIPNTLTLSVCIGEFDENRWEDRLMEVGEDGVYRATLRRLLDTAHYKVRAGDAESDVFAIRVYRKPQVDEFRVRLEYPEYTGRKPDLRPPGVGNIEALRGTRAVIKLKANTELASARATFGSGRTAADAVVKGRDAELTFNLEKNDQYQLQIRDQKDRGNSSPTKYRIRVLKDDRPRVRIMKPDRDLMVHKEQQVKVEISATDDYGVREVGIYHSLGVEEEKTMVRRYDPAPLRAKGYLKWELSNLGLKGGEVIAYYAYAHDTDTMNGPKKAKSELHFLTVYDEEEYDSPESPEKKNQPTPQSVRRLDKMIDVQKKLLKATFALSHKREEAEGKEPSPKERSDSEKNAKGQRALKKQLEGLIEQVKQEMERMAQAEQPQPDPDPEGGPRPPEGEQPLGEKEIKHMKASAGKMETAADELDKIKPTAAVPPEMEALRHLSETRRLLLSDKEGDPRFKMAMERESKRNRKKKRTQRQKDQQTARQELAELPPMMEREKKLERDLETLEDLDRELEEPARPDEANNEEELNREEERRQLKKQVQDELDQLAKDAEEREKSLRDLSQRIPEMSKPADRMEDAARQFEKAHDEAKKGKEEQAREEARQAARNVDQAHKGIRDALQKQLQQEMANLQRDAQELAQRQQDLAQDSRQAQRQQQQAGQQQQQSGQQQQQSGQQQQAGQQQQRQQSGSQQQQQGSQSGQQQSGLKPSQLRSMTARQGEIADDLKDLAERVKGTAERAAAVGNAGSKSLEKAGKQAEEDAPAARATEKAEASLKDGKVAEAERDQRKAARAMEAIGRSLQEALQKSEAADMKKLAEALKKAQALARKQDDVNKDIANKRDPAALSGREEKIAASAKELAKATGELEALKRMGRSKNTREQFKQAAERAQEAAKALAGQDTAKAKTPAERAAKALNAAVNQMERAVGKTMEQKAREALAHAKASREHQDKASKMARQLPEAPKGEKQAPMSGNDAEKRDKAAENERKGAERARRLEKALEGLEELAQEANPVASMVAREANEQIKEERVPQEMDDLAGQLEQIGRPRDESKGEKQGPISPKQAAEKGEEISKELKSVEAKLNQFIAEAAGDRLSKLQAMERETRQASQKAKQLAKDATKRPDQESSEKDPKTKDGKPSDPTEEASKLEKDLKALEPRLKRLEPGAPERAQLKKALEALKEARQANPNAKPNPDAPPQESNRQSSGRAFKRTQEALDSVASGLVERIERILKAREVKPEPDEDAPKEYRTLVEDYYRALSEDTEEE